MEVLSELFLKRGLPCHIRSDNGPEFTAKVVRRWLEKFEIKNLFIEPGSPWEIDYNESFNGKLRDELLSGEIFNNLKEAEILIEQWRKEYNGQTTFSSELSTSCTFGSNAEGAEKASPETNLKGGPNTRGWITPVFN